MTQNRTQRFSNNNQSQEINAQVLPASKTANLSARDMVMLEFQRTSLDITRSFIESQQRVMLAYLTRAEVPGAATFPQILPAQIQNYNLPAVQEYRTVEQLMPVLEQTQVPARQPQVLIQSPLTSASYSDTLPHNATVEEEQAATQVANTTAPSSGVLFTVPATTNSSVSANASSPEQLIEALVSIVADRTGYPPEMLDPTLDLEADLGIDSIKRVEILNSFRKLLPEEKQNSLEDGIERLAGVKTLQGIMDWIRTELDSNKPAGTSSESSVSQLDSVSAQAG